MTEAGARPLRLAVLCPHFEPDTAPTGAVMTRIVHELVALGHEVHVITSLPWYRAHAIEPGWTGRRVRRVRMPWGSITRVDPFPGDDKANLVRRATGFAGFSALALWRGVRGGKVDGVLSMSPPLTNGVVGWAMKLARRGPLVFNIQDVFPDAAIETGAITNPVIIAAARALEKFSYRRADAVTVLSADLRDNVVAKLPKRLAGRVRVNPQLRAHRRDPAARPDDGISPAARHRHRTRRPVRRQRRLLAIARAGGRRSAGDARRHVRDQRRRFGQGQAGR